MTGSNKELKGTFLRIRTSGPEDWQQEGYRFHGHGFTDSPAVLEVGTYRQHGREFLEFLGEEGEGDR